MIPQELQQYIQKARLAKTSDADIGNDLLKAGWAPEAIKEALGGASATQKHQKPPGKKTGLIFTLVVIAIGVVGVAGYFLVTRLTNGTLQSNGTPPDVQGPAKPQLDVGSDISVHGIVLENVANDADSGNPAYFVIDRDGDRVRITYSLGDAECLNFGAEASGLDVSKGDQVTVYGEVTAGAEMSTCNTLEYFIRIDSSETVQGANPDAEILGTVVTIQSIGGLCSYGQCQSRINILKNGKWDYADGEGLNDRGTFDRQRITTLENIIETTEFDTVRQREFTETCPTAYDGQRNIYNIHLSSGDELIDDCKTNIVGVPLITNIREFVDDVHALIE